MTTNPLDPQASIITSLTQLANAEPNDLIDVLEILSNKDLEKIWKGTEELRGIIQAVWMDRDDPTECAVCATPIARDELGRPRQYCSSSCRQKAYRDRARAASN
jgi:hypothetical protein